MLLTKLMLIFRQIVLGQITLFTYKLNYFIKMFYELQNLNLNNYYTYYMNSKKYFS